MVSKTYSLKISLFISALFFDLFCTPSQADYICNFEYSSTSFAYSRSRCVSTQAQAPKITYACDVNSCRAQRFSTCYEVSKDSKGFHINFSKTVQPERIQSYRAARNPLYFEGYSDALPRGSSTVPPLAMCLPPISYARCTICTINK
ncbi:hypothetical protein O181_060564 [Austropuccinia psidii MF-1]|uniref:Secreted protein n=1 Tax=Austropuccinia psidii MF-1 TaxID=1389203 RepID=A0A9Q3EGK9_9BASI|nr:hypothetical protein [Austropuccinia psidii MF-1]